MATDLADHAYGHCLAVLIRPSAAENAALAALRRGARTTTGMLAHARWVALQVPGSDTPGPGDADGRSRDDPLGEVGSGDLTEVARRLTAGRPASERAVVDLHGRHGLDRLRLARSLGIDPSAAARLVAAVTDRWATALDPALLAHLGPGECPGLADLLAERGLGPPGADEPPASAGPTGATPAGADPGPGRLLAPERTEVSTAPAPAPAPVTVKDLLASAPAVLSHIDGCQPCRDRLRAMISVRDLVAGIPLESAPGRLRTVMPLSRRRRRAVPAPLPIASPSGRLPRRPRPVRVLTGAALVALVAAGVTGVVIAGRGGPGGRSDRVRALTSLPPADALDTHPATISIPNGTFLLSNRSGRTVRWQAASPVQWLTLNPPGGTLGPHGQAVVAGRLEAGAPSSGPTVVVAITGDDGSATAVTATVAATSPAPVTASTEACTVTATTGATAGAGSVTLYWQPVAPGAGEGEHTVAMVEGAFGYTADLPAASGPLRWWVVADAGGRPLSSPAQLLAPGSCL